MYGRENNGVMTQHIKEAHVKTLLSSSLVFQKKWYASKYCAQYAISFNFNGNPIFPKIPRLMQSRKKLKCFK